MPAAAINGTEGVLMADSVSAVDRASCFPEDLRHRLDGWRGLYGTGGVRYGVEEHSDVRPR